ncbi:hypothetical protein, partial [Bacillus cereus group sp. Bce002]|uniref:hypothetical protein n=1 Tax=Bacillus cereus group sp. Bce002 TaxID=3445259 RepID=UPI003F22A605
MENINQQTWKQEMKARQKDRLSLFLFLLVGGAALATFLGILFIVGYILVKGIPNLLWSLFEWTYNSQNVS